MKNGADILDHTISGTAIKHSALDCPNIGVIGRIPKFPKNPPMFIAVATNVASSNVNGPIGKVVFSCCSSTKFIVPHPDELPNENAMRLSIYNEILYL